MQQQGGEASRLGSILKAANSYRSSLLQLYHDLDIMRAYAGPPDYLLARLVVAEIIGGVALPAVDSPCVGVFGPEGQPVRVFTTDQRDGFRRYWNISQKHTLDEAVALVVFDLGAPVFVHIIPAESLRWVIEEFGNPWNRDSMWLSLHSHCDFLLDPLTAEVLGIQSFDLSELS